MVIIHLKGDGERLHKEECLYECVAADTSVGDLTDMLTRMQNARVRLRFMMDACKQLRKRFEDTPERACTCDGPIADATKLLDPNQVEIYKRRVSLAEYEECMAALKGCAIILYPQHCAASHGKKTAVQYMCEQLDDEDCEDCDLWRMLLALVDDGARHDDMFNVGGTQLWWAGKQLYRDELLKKYSGKNEKTKLVVKLSKQGAHCPQREPAIDKQSQQDMMAYYYKKQEEQKKLIDDEDISYANSGWADPRGLKNHFQGTGNINYRPKLG